MQITERANEVSTRAHNDKHDNSRSIKHVYLLVVIFLKVFQDGRLYPSFSTTTVISSSSYHRNCLAAFFWNNKKAIFFPTPLNSNAELLRNTTWPRWWSDNQSDLCLANYFQSKVCQWKTCVWQASKSLYTVIRPLYLHLHLTSVFRSTGFKTAAPQNVTEYT